MCRPTNPFVTIYILCYGDFVALHRRVLASLARFLPRGEARVIVWGNQLSQQAQRLVHASVGAFEEHWYKAHHTNLPKYQVMRHLWHEHPDTIPHTPWVLWLDDDTHITKQDWWPKTKAFIESKKDENICYVGEKWFVHHLKGQAEFIEQAKWYKGVPFQQHPTRKRGVTRPGIAFATGAYVWLRTDVMRQLDWPDERLVHNGGDTLLGEAIHQQGLPFHKFNYGVAVNKARRRGRSDRPAGSTENVRR